MCTSHPEEAVAVDAAAIERLAAMDAPETLPALVVLGTRAVVAVARADRCASLRVRMIDGVATWLALLTRSTTPAPNERDAAVLRVRAELGRLGDDANGGRPRRPP